MNALLTAIYFLIFGILPGFFQLTISNEQLAIGWLDYILQPKERIGDFIFAVVTDKNETYLKSLKSVLKKGKMFPRNILPSHLLNF
jgi:hypothetical protein